MFTVLRLRSNASHPAKRVFLSRPMLARRLALPALCAGILATAAQAQMYQRTIGTAADERGEWVEKTADNGYIMTGYHNSPPGAHVIKITAGGNVQWETLLGGGGYSPTGNRVIATPSGYMIAGEISGGPVNHGIFLAQIALDGSLQWARIYPGTAGVGGAGGGTSLAQVPGSGDWLIGGRIQLFPTVQQAPVLILVDALGNTQWIHYFIDNRYGAQTFGAFNDVEALAPDALFAAGFTNLGIAGDRDTLFVKLQGNGTVVWSKSYSTPLHHDEVYGLEPAANGDWLLCGFNKNTGEGGGSFLMRTDSTGTLLWYKTFFQFGTTAALRETPSGDIVLGGYANSDPALLKTSSLGVFTWCQEYGLTPVGYAKGLVNTSDGGYFLAGANNAFGQGQFDFHVIKTDVNGSTGCHEAPFLPALANYTPLVLDVPLTVISDMYEQILGVGNIATTSTPFVFCTSGSVSSFCFGDGTLGLPCPCFNFGSAGRGCANSVNSAGALLAATGTPNPDTIVLSASGMPSITTPSAILLQGDALISSVVFGDGVRCIGGNLLRLGKKPTPIGSCQYPDTGDLALSIVGGVTPGSGVSRWYMFYYRNAVASFCPTATFNATNGVEIVW